MSSEIIFFAKDSEVEDQLKDGGGNPRILSNNYLFISKRLLVLWIPKSLKTAYHLKHIKRYLEILSS